MIHKVVVFVCVVMSFSVGGMELVEQDKGALAPYFSPGEKSVTYALLRGLKWQVKTAEDMHKLAYPLVTTCKQCYAVFNSPWAAQNMIGRWAFYAKKSRNEVAQSCSKMRYARKYMKLNNGFHQRMLELAVTLEETAVTAEQEISVWWERGIDINFDATEAKITPLMTAVYQNNPAFVGFFLDRNPDLSLCNNTNDPARAYNCLYEGKYIGGAINDIVSYMVRLRNSRVHGEAVDNSYEPFVRANERELRDAISIDKLLENAGAEPITNRFKSQFLKILKDKESLASQVVRNLYHNDQCLMKLCVPVWLYEFLWL